MGKRSCPNDRVSILPEPILHHILSFLPAKEAIQASFVSKPCYQAWTTLPYINLGSELFRPRIFYPQSIRKRNQRLAFIDQTLIRHKTQGTSIHRFQLHVFRICAELSLCLDRWIDTLVQCNIKELDLKFYSGSPNYCLPSSLLRAKSLTSLKLQHCDLPSGETEIDPIPNLERLSYTDLSRLPTKVLATCTNLKYVSLCEPVNSECFRKLMSELTAMEVLDISYIGLERIQISNYSIKKLYLRSSYNLTELELDTPKLGYLRYEGRLSISFLVNLGEVVSVDLNLASFEAAHFAELIQLINNFKHCSILRVTDVVLMSLIISKERRENLFAVVPHIKELRVVTDFHWLTHSRLVGLVDSLLWLTPSLESLTIRGNVKGKLHGYSVQICVKFIHEKLSTEECCGCVLPPRNCWKHSLKMVKFEYLESIGVDVAEVRTCLKTFFWTMPYT